MSVTTNVKVAKLSFLNDKSYNKTVIDFNFGRHKDLSARKCDNSQRPSIDFNFGRHKDLSTRKVIIYRGLALTSISVDIRIYLPEKVIIHRGLALTSISVDIRIYLPEKVIIH